MAENARPKSRVLGSLRSEDGVGVVRIEDRCDTDTDDLWAAITDPARLARWHGQVEGDLRPGGEFRLYIEADDKCFPPSPCRENESPAPAGLSSVRRVGQRLGVAL